MRRPAIRRPPSTGSSARSPSGIPTCPSVCATPSSLDWPATNASGGSPRRSAGPPIPSEGRSELRRSGTEAGAREQARAYGAHELFRRNRLSQDAGDVDRAQVLGRAGDDDDRDVAGDGARGDLLLNRQAAERRQAEVEHDEVGEPFLDPAQRLAAVAGFLDVEGFEVERELPHPTQIGVVIDDQNESLFSHLPQIGA